MTRLSTPPPPPRPKIIAFGPLRSLDALGIVEVAEILRIVTHAVHKKVGRRTLATNDDLITIILALVPVNSWHVANYILELLRTDILNLLSCDDGNRLWNVD